MKVTVNEEGDICLEEVFNGIELKSTDGESISICMRDGGFEMRVGGKWYTINNGNIKMMSTGELIVENHEIALRSSQLLLARLNKIGNYTMIEDSELILLKRDSEKLRKLEAAGVDNWEGDQE